MKKKVQSHLRRKQSFSLDFPGFGVHLKAQPVLKHVQVPYFRATKSKTQLEAEAMKAEFEKQLEELQQSAAEKGIDLKSQGKKQQKRNPGGRQRALVSVPLESSNRKLPHKKARRHEFPAKFKLKMSQDMRKAKESFTSMSEFWKCQVQKYALERKTLQNILSKEEHWSNLVQQQKLKTASGKKAKAARVRSSGGGRKDPFQSLIAVVKQWIQVERTSGHTLTKSDLFQEYLLLLDQKAAQCQLQASNARTEFDRIKLEAQANLARQRKQKLLESKGYAKSFTKRLLDNTGSKWRTAEVVSNISELESRVRCQATWQAFDSALYKATLASAEELKASGLVAAPEQYVQARSEHFMVGFSDQVPLWAKSQGKKALFAEHEMHSEQNTKDFSGVRDAIAEALSNKQEPCLVVGTLPRHQGKALSTPDFSKQGSHTSFTSAAPSSFERKPSLDTDISSPGSIRKKLSFGESGNDEAVISAAKDSATASQEPKASAEEQPATAASDEPKASAEEQPATAASDEPKASAEERPATAASDEPKASAEEQPATAASDEPKASAKKPSANTKAPGSLTVVGHSTDERFRITYEARQLISGLDGSGSKPEGHVGKGLLVVPGTWARPSNISDDGRWIKHEEFKVGSKTFVHGQGRSVGRILESWRQLRKDRPELFERIEVNGMTAFSISPRMQFRLQPLWQSGFSWLGLSP